MTLNLPPSANSQASPDPGSGRIQSVERALRILLAFGDAPAGGLTLAELARTLGVHKSTASRLVATLVDAGFLDRGDDGADAPLRLGGELARLGRIAAGKRGPTDVAEPVLAELAALTGETTTFAILDGTDVVTVAERAGAHVVGPHSWLGRRSPLHSTSDGKVFLAFGATSLPEGPLERLTPATVTDRRKLKAQLTKARAEGWATATGDFEQGLNGVAAPVLDAEGRCVATVCVSGPSYRLRPEDFPRVGAHCRDAGKRIGALLESSLPTPPSTGDHPV
jgi:DNA-binding IclR family transcriptional regulator